MTESLWIAFFAVGGFVLVWVLTIWSIGRFSGWDHLAAHYPAHAEPPGEKLSWQSAMIGMARYKGSLTYVLSKQGLYLVPMKLFRMGHPPLLIPWSEIARGKPGSEPAVFVRRVHYPFYEIPLQAGREEVRVRLPVGVIEKAREMGFL